MRPKSMLGDHLEVTDKYRAAYSDMIPTSSGPSLFEKSRERMDMRKGGVRDISTRSSEVFGHHYWVEPERKRSESGVGT